MASPYFTPIQTSRSDFSGILQAGRAQGNMYSNLGALVGKTVQEVGSMYFEDKKLGRSFSDFLKTEDGERFAIDEMGYTPEQVAKWRENPALIDKEVKQTFADLGGTKEIRKSIQQKTEHELKMDRERQLLENSQTQAEILETQAAQAKELQAKMDATKEIFAYHYRENPDGTIAKNLDGYSKMQEHAPYISELTRNGELRGFSAANFSEYLMQDKTVDITDEMGMLQKATTYAALTNAPQADVKAFMEQAKAMTIAPSEIQKTAEAKIFDADPIMKSRMETVGRFGELMASYNNAIAYKVGEDGKREAYIKNPTSAAMLQRAMAKIGNGGGNMTDRDVEAISGQTDYKSQWSRIYKKFMPNKDPEVAASALLAEDIEFIGQAGQAIFDFSNDYVQTGVKQGLEATKSAYSDRLSMPQVVKHSGFQKYLGFDSGGVDIRTGSIKAATDDDVFNGQKIPAASTARVINRLFEDGDMTMNEVEEQFQMANPQMSIDDIRAKINYAVEFGKLEDTNQQKVKDEEEEKKQNPDTGAAQNARPEFNTLGTVAASAATGAAGAAASGRVADAISNRMTFADGFPETNKAKYLKDNPLQSLETAKNGDLKKLKSMAGKMGIKDLESYRGIEGEKKLRKKVLSRVNSGVTKKVSQWAAKKAGRAAWKKFLLAGMGAAISGGATAALSAASYVYDLYSMVEENRDASLAEIDKALAMPDVDKQTRTALERQRDKILKQGTYGSRFYFGKK